MLRVHVHERGLGDDLGEGAGFEHQGVDLLAIEGGGEGGAGAEGGGEAVGVEVGTRAVNAGEEGPCGEGIAVAEMSGEEGVERGQVSLRQFVEQVVGLFWLPAGKLG